MLDNLSLRFILLIVLRREKIKFSTKDNRNRKVIRKQTYPQQGLLVATECHDRHDDSEHFKTERLRSVRGSPANGTNAIQKRVVVGALRLSYCKYVLRLH